MLGNSLQRRVSAAVALCAALLLAAEGLAAAADSARHNPFTTVYTITVDATALAPPTWWQVPGVTPLVSSLDPDSTDAFRTTSPQDLKLKPGSYWFGTFTFDFQFAVTPEGVLDFAPSLDQCVEGRGTRTLKVRCSQTQPYGGQREY
jgi:hypothetical protein